MTKAVLLLVEDDEGLRCSLERSLARRGHDLLAAGTVAQAARFLRERRVDLVLADLRLPDGSGLEVLQRSRDIDEEIVVIMMTAYPEVRTAVNAIKGGAHDFIIKPFELEELHLVVGRALEAIQLRRKVRRLERETHLREEITQILGQSPAIEQLRRQIHRIAPTEAPVLIVGETGTGKELVADSIHRLSPRAHGPLIKANCSAFAEQLLESELFGHEKGAFTDAKESRAGLFEMARGGTLVLDEIAEMKPGLQAKLLRVTEGGRFRRVGGTREIRSDVRLVASTNRDLPAMIREGGFRQDLYFRLNVFEIRVPPLRARGDDTTLLARAFLARFAAALRKPEPVLTDRAAGTLRSYRWPGNVRELRNVMERAMIFTETGEVDREHLPGELAASAFIERQVTTSSDAMPSLAEIERLYIAHILERTGGNISDAARLLGIARNTLKAKLRTTQDA